MAALLCSRTRAEAADKLGITQKTLRKYINDPVFKACYAAARYEFLDRTTAALQQNMHAAASALAEIAASPTANEHARVSAARATLEFGIRLTEAIDTERRLEALEAASARGRQYEQEHD